MKKNFPCRYRLSFCLLSFFLTCFLTCFLNVSVNVSGSAGHFLRPSAAWAASVIPEDLRIAVASDLHFDPDNTDKSSGPSHTVYNMDLADALLYDVEEQGASLLLLTGDIVNGGKRHRHKDLIEKLHQAEESGLHIYVVPGNHDLAPVKQQEFAALYSDFGYVEAYSRDIASLSYCVMRDDLGICLLMMDTAGYSADAIDLPDSPYRTENNAFLSGQTLQWAETMLAEAKARSLLVISAGHFNLLTDLSRDPERPSYYLENGERFTRLLKDYHVPLYASGHLHTRLVMQEDGLTELVTEYPLAYPTGYSLLDLTRETITYTPRRVDVDAWAAATEQTDPILLRFSDWQQEELYHYAYENIDHMTGKNPLSEQEIVQASDFFYAVMDAYWNGTLYEQSPALEEMPGCELFFQCSEGYAYNWWLRDLMHSSSPLLAGFRLER